MLPTDIDMMRIWEIKNYERRVHDAIDLGYAYDVSSPKPNVQTVCRDRAQFHIE